jgi:uncharacterized membrane protein
VKSSKAQIHAKFHKIATIRFEDQKLTSFSGLLIFQMLFTRIKLKRRLKRCFTHLKICPIFGRHCTYLFLAYLKFLTKLGLTLTALIRILQLNLFQKLTLEELFKLKPDRRKVQRNINKLTFNFC